jgi:uncharacterized protein YjiS (DUF1127 family)
MTTLTHAASATHISARRSGSVLTRIADMFAVYRQRRALARLDAHALEDLGLTSADVAREIRRPVWDVPGYWRA